MLLFSLLRWELQTFKNNFGLLFEGYVKPKETRSQVIIDLQLEEGRSFSPC